MVSVVCVHSVSCKSTRLTVLQEGLVLILQIQCLETGLLIKSKTRAGSCELVALLYTPYHKYPDLRHHSLGRTVNGGGWLGWGAPPGSLHPTGGACAVPEILAGSRKDDLDRSRLQPGVVRLQHSNCRLHLGSVRHLGLVVCAGWGERQRLVSVVAAHSVRLGRMAGSGRLVWLAAEG